MNNKIEVENGIKFETPRISDCPADLRQEIVNEGDEYPASNFVEKVGFNFRRPLIEKYVEVNITSSPDPSFIDEMKPFVEMLTPVIVRITKEDRNVFKGSCGRIGEEYACLRLQPPYAPGWSVIGTAMGIALEDGEEIVCFSHSKIADKGTEFYLGNGYFAKQLLKLFEMMPINQQKILGPAFEWTLDRARQFPQESTDNLAKNPEIIIPHDWAGEGERCAKCGDSDMYPDKSCSEAILKRKQEQILKDNADAAAWVRAQAEGVTGEGTSDWTIGQCTRAIANEIRNESTKRIEDIGKLVMRELDTGGGNYLSLRERIAEFSGYGVMAICLEEHFKKIKEKLEAKSDTCNTPEQLQLNNSKEHWKFGPISYYRVGNIDQITLFGWIIWQEID